MSDETGAAASVAPAATDIAWAAGLFDGEGCFALSRRWKGGGQGYTQDRFYARAAVQMADVESVERFARIVGVGNVCACAISEKHHRPTVKWNIEAHQAIQHVVALLAPYLSSEKLVKALNVLAADSRSKAC